MKLLKEIVEHITRPPREQYLTSHLGAPNFTVQAKDSSTVLACRRQDEVLVNDDGLCIQVSFYQNHITNSKCILYLHANSSCRLQVLQYLKLMMSHHYSLCSFDFAGSGISEGETSTAGFKQSKDIKVVISYLLNKGVKDIILWGRSMGAVAALIYASQAHSAVSCLVLDSAFQDLQALIKQKAAQLVSLPQALFTPLLYCVDDSLGQEVNVRLSDLNIKKYLSSQAFSALPALFVASKEDQVVGSHHSEELYRCYSCSKKRLLYIQSSHNQVRHPRTVEHILTVVDGWSNRSPKISLTSLLEKEEGKKNGLAKDNAYKWSLSMMSSSRSTNFQSSVLE